MSEELHNEYKIVIVGAGGCGKSCLTNKFLTGFFTEDYDPTIEDSYTKKTQIDDEVCILDILDTAGQEEYSAMLDDYMRNGQGFICVYSVTDSESFRQVNKFREKLWAVKDRSLNDTLPFVLVGNKVDMADKRQVTTEEGEFLARQYKCTLLEASAKHGINVTEAFHHLIREIRKDRAVKGYTLKKSAGPDEKMMEKMSKRFAKWGFVKSAKKTFGRLASKVMGTDKKEDKTPPTAKKSSQASFFSTNSPSNSPKATIQPAKPPSQNPSPVVQRQSNADQHHPPSGFSYTPDPQRNHQPSQYNPQMQPQQQIRSPPQQHHPEPQQQYKAYNPEPQQPTRNPNQSMYGGDILRNSGGNSNSSTLVVKPEPYISIPRAVDTDFGKYDFFFGKISGTEVNQILAGKPVGTYLVRFSSQPNHLAASYVLDYEGAIQSVLIGYDSSGIWMVDGEVNPTKYSSLENLIRDYDRVLQYPFSQSQVGPHYGKIPALNIRASKS